MRANRLALTLAGAAGAVAMLAAPTQASAVQAGTTTTTEICSSTKLQAGVNTWLCAEVTGGDVQLVGKIYLAGPPSPGGPYPEPQDLLTVLDGQVVGGASLGSVNKWTRFHASLVEVRGVGGAVTCGSTVHGSFSVTKPGWGSVPVTLDAVVPC
ncbi:hypothetical protein ABT093_14500 [Kitasatospora sp. NPDC002551]|uniref:hypothetical protein n=1 Tax=unclassified Kitasatospora TaxID=2633591 RepID=UPI00331D335F